MAVAHTVAAVACSTAQAAVCPTVMEVAAEVVVAVPWSLTPGTTGEVAETVATTGQCLRPAHVNPLPHTVGPQPDAGRIALDFQILGKYFMSSYSFLISMEGL